MGRARAGKAALAHGVQVGERLADFFLYEIVEEMLVAASRRVVYQQVERLLVLEDVVDDAGDHVFGGAPHVFGAPFVQLLEPLVVARAEEPEQVRGHGLDQRGEQRAFVREAHVQRAGGHAGVLRDAAQARLLVSLVQKLSLRALQHETARFLNLLHILIPSHQ